MASLICRPCLWCNSSWSRGWSKHLHRRISKFSSSVPLLIPLYFGRMFSIRVRYWQNSERNIHGPRILLTGWKQHTQKLKSPWITVQRRLVWSCLLPKDPAKTMKMLCFFRKTTGFFDKKKCSSPSKLSLQVCQDASVAQPVTARDSRWPPAWCFSGFSYWCATLRSFQTEAQQTTG